MYLNRVAVNKTLEQKAVALVGCAIQQYWTSTQNSGNNSWAVGFYFFLFNKNNYLSLRGKRNE
jgi:hypothetical protein